MIHASEHKSAAPLTPAGLRRPGISRTGDAAVPARDGAAPALPRLFPWQIKLQGTASPPGSLCLAQKHSLASGIGDISLPKNESPHSQSRARFGSCCPWLRGSHRTSPGQRRCSGSSSRHARTDTHPDRDTLGSQGGKTAQFTK